MYSAQFSKNCIHTQFIKLLIKKVIDKYIYDTIKCLIFFKHLKTLKFYLIQEGQTTLRMSYQQFYSTF